MYMYGLDMDRMDHNWKPNGPAAAVELSPACPRCGSANTKFCYYNNYSLTQPRYFCKSCRRYWTKGGSLRNVPVGGGCRKSRRGKSLRLANPRTNPNNPNPSPESSEPNRSGSSTTTIDLAAVYANFVSQTTTRPPPVENHEVPPSSQDQILIPVGFPDFQALNLDSPGLLLLPDNLSESQFSEEDASAIYYNGYEGFNQQQQVVGGDDCGSNLSSIISSMENGATLPPLPGEEMAVVPEAMWPAGNENEVTRVGGDGSVEPGRGEMNNNNMVSEETMELNPFGALNLEAIFRS